jgi:ribosome-binding ATPase YchF (GTP1/OBG family)
MLIVYQMQKRKVPTFFCTIEPNIGVVNVPDSY